MNNIGKHNHTQRQIGQVISLTQNPFGYFILKYW
jgi:hypothetical protein